MATMSRLLHCSPVSGVSNLSDCHCAFSNQLSFNVSVVSFTSSASFARSCKLSFNPLEAKSTRSNHFVVPFALSSAGGNSDDIGGEGGGGGGDGEGNSGGSGSGSGGSDDTWGILGFLLSGWRSRVTADPQFPFKVLMEELVGVSACVIGDMASRPNFGLNELDFVFSTLVVGCILNFTLMYLLAPTMASSGSALPAIFANCPSSHMFEPGAYTILNRFGTFVYKGAVFAAVGFAAGLVGTAISNGLIAMRKKMDPSFETPNKPPPTLLNALTWAAHMGISSNFRYQTLNGIEFVLDKVLPPFIFKTSVIVLRCMNNVLGGSTFVILARLTGSQNAEKGKNVSEEAISISEKEKLVDATEVLSSSQSSTSN